MAIFTSQFTGQVLTGTPNPDLFVLSAATGLAIFGQAGADTIDGVTRTGNLDNSFVTMAGGADSIFLTGDLSASDVFLGAGGDTLRLSGDIDGSTVAGGDGSDAVITLEEVQSSTLTLGAGADRLVASAIESSTVGMGAGNDTITVNGRVTASEVNMGGGSDLLVASSIASSVVTMGAGSDTVSLRFGIESSEVQLGGNADLLIASSITADSTVNGGAGADTILVDGDFQSSTIFGDAGSDFIDLDEPGLAGSALVDGGAGADTISIGTGRNINVIGGQGADLIQFNNTANPDIKYTQASESNLTTFDTLQVVPEGNAIDTATAWIAVSSVIPQEVTVGSSITGPNFNTDNSGRVTFKGGVGSTLVERVDVLSQDLNAGQFVIFDAEGNQFLFMGGNDLNSTNDDLVIQLANNTVVKGIDTAGFSRVRVEFES